MSIPMSMSTPTASAGFDWPDPTHLRDHCRQCAFALGPLHRVQCAAESLHAFLTPRFVTLLTTVTVLLLAGLSLPV